MNAEKSMWLVRQRTSNPKERKDRLRLFAVLAVSADEAVAAAKSNSPEQRESKWWAKPTDATVHFLHISTVDR